VEANAATLARLPVSLPTPQASAPDTVAALARFTRQFAPDRTNHHWGRLLKWLKLRKSMTRGQFAEQAEQIIPAAAGHLAALYQQFLDATRPS
jgi:hypothetical protein